MEVGFMSDVQLVGFVTFIGDMKPTSRLDRFMMEKEIRCH